MRVRLVGLLASLSAYACAAVPGLSASTIAIYYSFDGQPASAAWKSMQVEVARIFDPASVSFTWRTLDASSGAVDGELVVVRFHGACTADHWPVAGRDFSSQGGYSLAASDISNGQVLPFANIDCDALRGYLAGERFADPAASLGKAMARVLSHEIYHILTASTGHAHSGVARAAHSRAELVSDTFTFGKSETDWLKEWSLRLKMASAQPVADDAGQPAASDADVGLR